MINIGDIEISLISPPDRDLLVAALTVDRQQLAEINRESGGLAIELYGRQDGSPWNLPLLDFVAAAASAAAILDERLGHLEP